MKRSIMIAVMMVAASVVAVGAAFGQDLWSYQKFQAALDGHNKDYEANGGPWPHLQDSCALCHGVKGQSQNARYPSLAGLSEQYIEAQLHAFAEGRRKNPYMGPYAANLSDEQIKRLAEYYGRQSAVKNEITVAAAAERRIGQQAVATLACASCHGEKLTGTEIAPRIAGQGEFYLSDQLHAYKSGQRADPAGTMNGITAGLSEAQIEAAAHYLANLNTTEPQQPK
nr:c-type cytochrome [Sphingomonas sp. CDS-1]